MTKGEVLVNFIKETFPDLVEMLELDDKEIIDPDEINICDFINCDECYCHDCAVNKTGIVKDKCNNWAKQEYIGPVKTSNSTTTAITSGEISW